MSRLVLYQVWSHGCWLSFKHKSLAIMHNIASNRDSTVLLLKSVTWYFSSLTESFLLSWDQHQTTLF
jgi:hypothetical protein